jgi:hypothetical protein
MHKRSFLLAATSSTALGVLGCSQDDGSALPLDPMASEPDARGGKLGSTVGEPGVERPTLAPVVRERAYGARVVSTEAGRRFELAVGEHPLTELDADDQPVLAIGKFGTGPTDLNAPTGVLEGPNGDLYVVDRGNSRIQVYNADGSHLRSLGRWGKGEGELSAPASATWTRDGRLAVADSLNHRIVIFEIDGSSSHSFGKLGFGDGEFNFPQQIVCDAEGRMVVLDRGNQRLQYFSAEGRYLSSVEVSELIRPRSLVAVPDGTVLLADPGRGVLASVKADGAMTFQLLEFPAVGRAAIPHALELAPEGKLFVYATAEPAGG